MFLQTNNKVLQEAIDKAQQDNKKLFDKKRRSDLDLKPGDSVRLSTTNLKMAYPSKKLAPK